MHRIHRAIVVVALVAMAISQSSARADEPLSEITNRVDGYQGALDAITRELILLLEKDPVLLVWCFDQSQSMVDDRREIRARLTRVYEELKLARIKPDALQTLVTSYGAKPQLHTREPLSDLEILKKALDTVPIDQSGHELMCTAALNSITYAKKFRGDGRQLMMIVVTDESGDRDDNLANLEKVIAAAKKERCPIYFLSRRATFAGRRAYFRWRHPQTKRWHYLAIDRGPETAFLELLDTDGFGRRMSPLTSPFGPYEQLRIVRETNGIFFSLPGHEGSLVKRKPEYRLETIRRYRPDLRSRAEILADHKTHPLQAELVAVAGELSVENKGKSLEKRFAVEATKSRAQMEEAGSKVRKHLEELAAADRRLANVEDARAAESLRWRANYDLTRGQLAAFQARAYEYQAAIDEFVADPPTAADAKPPNLRHVEWRIQRVQETRSPRGKRLIDVAKRRLQGVIRDYAGTPWARMAERELRDGFGVRLQPHYAPPTPKVPIQIPPPIL